MGKTRKWLRNLLISPKKHKDKHKGQYEDYQIPSSSSSTNASEIPIPKEKRRWSFRRPSETKQQLNNSAETNVTAATPPPPPPETAEETDRNLQNNHHLDIINTEDASAIKIQSVFRSHLARKALSALRGIVKLQALVRGQLVRKQASATLRCMEALLTAQARACAVRIKMASEPNSNNQRHSTIIRHVYDFGDEIDKEMEENIRIVKVDISGSRENSRSRKEENHKALSPAISGQSSPASSSKPEEKKLTFTSPVPNYMANTESSRAKFRSLSAPKQRPDSIERQLSRPRVSIEARSSGHRPVMKMRRSSSHVGSNAHHYQHPHSIKLDRSSVSLIESECGSTSTVLTNTQYCRSLISYDPHEGRYH